MFFIRSDIKYQILNVKINFAPNIETIKIKPGFFPDNVCTYLTIYSLENIIDIYVQTPNTVRYSELAGTVVFLSKWANFREKPNMSMGWESGFTISRGVDRTKTKYRVRAGFILEAQARQFWWIVYHFSYHIRFLTKTWFDDILLPSERKIGNGIQRRIFISIVCRNVCML